MGRRIAVLASSACSGFLLAALLVSSRAEEKPRIYADPKGRFSFHPVGDWVKLVADDQEGIAGSFLFTKKVGESRKVTAEMLIAMTECRAPVRLEDYVRAENRRVVNSPGFRRLGEQEELTLGGQPALKNRYALTPPGEPEETRKKVVYQYYVLNEDAVWGITLSARHEDEAVLAEIERTALSSFRFSVPEGVSTEPALEVFKKVAVTGAKGGFSVNLPEAWEVKQSEEQGVSIRGPEAVVYAFSVAREEEDKSLEDVAGAFLKERERLRDLRVLSQGTEDVAGRKGYVVEYTGVGEGRRWRVRLVTFVHGERAYFIHCVVPEEGWARNNDVLTRIGESFTVASPAGEAGDRK